MRASQCFTDTQKAFIGKEYWRGYFHAWVFLHMGWVIVMKMAGPYLLLFVGLIGNRILF